MLLDSNGRQFCGGSLIDLLWVVTATHCTDGKTAPSVKVRLVARSHQNLRRLSFYSFVIKLDLNTLGDGSVRLPNSHQLVRYKDTS